jgi:hypothetical protein
MPRSPRTPLLAALAASVALAVLVPVGAAVAATPIAMEHVAAVDAPAIAWTVETVDGPNGARRPNFTYTVDPGTVIADTMRVTNTGTTSLDLAVYAADAFTTPSGNIDLNTADAPSVDAGTWVAADTPQLTLAPGAQADIGFTITVPPDAAPGDHSAGLITSFRGGSDGATIDVDRRLGTRVTVRVAGELTPAVDVDDVSAAYTSSWNPFEPGVLVLSYRLTNAGNTLVTGGDESTASGPLGAFGIAVDRLALPEVIPGSTVDVRREVAIAPWGWITGEVVLHPEAVGLGAQDLAAVTVPYTVAAVPWTLLIAFAAIAAIAVTVWLVVRRRAARPTAGAGAGVTAAGAGNR